MLKNHWAETKQSQQRTECPVTALGSMEKPKEVQGGQLCILNDKGEVKSTLPLSMPAGMVLTDDHILVATNFAIHVARDLSSIGQETISLPAFNLCTHSRVAGEDIWLPAPVWMYYEFFRKR